MQKVYGETDHVYNIFCVAVRPFRLYCAAETEFIPCVVDGNSNRWREPSQTFAPRESKPYFVGNMTYAYSN